MLSNNLHPREISHYGSRPPASCKECRRLKLKCDKKVPCSSCVRRGCATICPNGQMVAKGTRFILANTEDLGDAIVSQRKDMLKRCERCCHFPHRWNHILCNLRHEISLRWACPGPGNAHEKIDELISRVHSLEGALEASHSLHSSESHPLLRNDLRSIATPVGSAIPNPEPVSQEEELVDSIGTLTLDGHGARYFGTTGSFASLWNDGDGPGGSDENDSKPLSGFSLAVAGFPLELAHMAHSFPIRIPTNENALHLSAWILENCLPSYEEAWSLFENYSEHYAWHSSPFTRTTFIQQILSPLYHKIPDIGDKPLGHRLAVLFMVFAIGQFMDFTQPIDISSGRRYYMLARASLCLEPVFENPTITALQAMYLIGVYIMMSRGSYLPEHAWIISGINTKLALTLGLRAYGGSMQYLSELKNFFRARRQEVRFACVIVRAYHWTLLDVNSAPVEVEARQQAMVSVICYETWLSLILGITFPWIFFISLVFMTPPGRHPSCTFSDFEWVLSKTPESVADLPLVSAPKWLPFFIRDCVGMVMSSASETRYSVILKIDAKIRDYAIPEPPKKADEAEGSQGISQLMQQTVALVLKDISMLFLHRRFFALALVRSPNDPLQSHFAPSVLACYRGAVAFLEKIIHVNNISPAIIQRVWFIWPNIFVATLILGSIVARSPGCALAPSALIEFEKICQLWDMTSEYVCGPKILETVDRLKQKAFMAFSQNKASQNASTGIAPGGVEVNDEITALGGDGPRVITSSKSRSPSNSPEHASEVVMPQVADSSFSGFADMSYYPTIQSYKSLDSDFSFDFTDGALPTDFNDIMKGMASSMQIDASASSIRPSLLDELGLSGGWQPVMDNLGL